MNWFKEKYSINMPQLLVLYQKRNHFKQTLNIWIEGSPTTCRYPIHGRTKILIMILAVHSLRKSNLREKITRILAIWFWQRKTILRKLLSFTCIYRFKKRYHAFKLLKKCCFKSKTFSTKEIKRQNNLFTKENKIMHFFETLRKLTIIFIQ